MKPVYLDLHIHTSENPDKLEENYDLDTLLEQVSKNANDADFLISLTDHNTINKKVYLDLYKKIKSDYDGSNLILGVELHIQIDKKDKEAKAYHCHLFFDTEITKENLDEISNKLDDLFLIKEVKKKDINIPTIEEILHKFDEYNLLILPHGGQTHATIDKAYKSLKEEKNFKNTLYKNIYYNFIDGFTARNISKKDKDLKFLKQLGIDEFVGYITSTDNYKPSKYPQGKHSEEGDFTPTWMFAKPTFNGLRVALSDVGRLDYGKDTPSEWNTSISKVKLNKENISIDIDFTPGLNVIIGESSSGKTLLVDSIKRCIKGEEFDNAYDKEYGVKDIEVNYKSTPHFIEQNYIGGIVDKKKYPDTIEPLKQLFPSKEKFVKEKNQILSEVKDLLTEIFNSVEELEKIEDVLTGIPTLQELITFDNIPKNPLNLLKRISKEFNKDLEYDSADIDIKTIDRIHDKLNKHPIIKHKHTVCESLKEEIKLMQEYSCVHKKLQMIIENTFIEINDEIEGIKDSEKIKHKEFETLIDKMMEYRNYYIDYRNAIQKLITFNKELKTPIKTIGEHTLYYDGDVKINANIVVDILNQLLRKGNEIGIDELKLNPNKLYSKNFDPVRSGSNPNTTIPTYSQISGRVYENIYGKMEETPKINTRWNKTERDFYELSPGLKSAVILDIIMQYRDGYAPIIIDQPEDNLSIKYINDIFVERVKDVKKQKQIILVSHNATIPMIGDAQNIIYCKNVNGKITIRSASLEGEIDGERVVDIIAKVTDGGKISVKKRFKKYNLKRFNKKEYEQK